MKARAERQMECGEEKKMKLGLLFFVDQSLISSLVHLNTVKAGERFGISTPSL